MNKWHKLTSLMLAAVLCISLLSQASASISFSGTAVLTHAKISDVLKDKLQSGENIKTTAMVWLSDIDMQTVEEEALSVCTVERGASARDISTDECVSEVDVQKYIETKRAMAAEKYRTQNERIANALFTPEDIIFVSKYSPVILVSLDATTALTVAQSKNVTFLDFYCEETQLKEVLSPMATSAQRGKYKTLPMIMDLIRVTDVQDSITFGYTGSGVKIGIIEDSFPTPSYHPNITLTYYGTWYEGSYTDHADAVLSIISTIAPEAEYYAVNHSGYDATQLLPKIEWLLSQGVNVINSSRALSENADTYDSIAKWIDHIAYQHDVHFVQATGNSSAEIESSALAYNAVAVGSINVGLISTEMEDFIIDAGSGRNNTETFAYKPDLCALGERFTIPSLEDFPCDGTSFATPQVTGVIALLCEQNVNLRTSQTAVKAILTASVNFDYSKRFVPSHANYRVYGAGLLDCLGACWVAGNYRFVSATLPSNTNSATHSFTVTSSDSKIRVSLAYNMQSAASGSHGVSNIALGTFRNLDLEVYDSNGNIVGSSITTRNNVEIVEFDNPTPGTYTIVVRRGDSSTEALWYGLAWR